MYENNQIKIYIYISLEIFRSISLLENDFFLIPFTTYFYNLIGIFSIYFKLFHFKLFELFVCIYLCYHHLYFIYVPMKCLFHCVPSLPYFCWLTAKSILLSIVFRQCHSCFIEFLIIMVNVPQRWCLN